LIKRNTLATGKYLSSNKETFDKKKYLSNGNNNSLIAKILSRQQQLFDSKIYLINNKENPDEKAIKQRENTLAAIRNT
jgi:hypothetical protein